MSHQVLSNLDKTQEQRAIDKSRFPGYRGYMGLLTACLIASIALLHLYFLILEMFLWTKPKGLKVFGQSLEQAKSSAVLAANQGLYNGFLAAGLLWSLSHSSPEFSFQLKLFFLTCVLIAGLYGGYSVSKKIAYVQGLPAAVAIVLLMMA